jgi:hypothetical protein
MDKPIIIRFLIDDERTFELAEHFIVDKKDNDKLVEVVELAYHEWYSNIDELEKNYEGVWYYVLTKIKASGIKTIDPMVRTIKL